MLELRLPAHARVCVDIVDLFEVLVLVRVVAAGDFDAELHQPIFILRTRQTTGREGGEGGREGRREGGKEEGREGKREGRKEGGTEGEGGGEGGEGGKEGGRQRGTEGGKERGTEGGTDGWKGGWGPKKEALRNGLPQRLCLSDARARA